MFMFPLNTDGNKQIPEDDDDDSGSLFSSC